MKVLGFDNHLSWSFRCLDCTYIQARLHRNQETVPLKRALSCLCKRGQEGAAIVFLAAKIKPPDLHLGVGFVDEANNGPVPDSAW